MINNNQFTITCDEILSSKPHKYVPDVVEVSFGDAFCNKAERCMEFMAANGVDKVTIEHAFDYQFLRQCETKRPDSSSSQPLGYEIMQPTDANVWSSFVEITKAGCITASFFFTDDRGEVWCEVGSLEDIKRSGLQNIPD